MGRHSLTAYAYDKRETLIGSGSNSYTKTHPLMSYFGQQVGAKNQPYIHAELAALLKCGRKKPYRLFIKRIKKDGTTGNAKPCIICERAIKAWGVQHVVYTT